MGVVKLISYVLILTVLLSAFVYSSPADYLYIEGIRGDSRDNAHRDWIEISKLYHHTDGCPDSHPSQDDSQILSMRKYVDIATPKLMHKQASGDVIPAFYFDVLCFGGNVCAKRVYTNVVIIDSYKFKADDYRSGEVYTFSYETSHITYVHR